MSGTALKKLGKELINSMKMCIGEIILPHLQAQILKNLPKNSFEITLSEDGESIHFNYQSDLSNQTNYLREHVLVEFGVRNTTEPCEKIELKPYLSSILDKQIKLPNPVIEVLSPIRTFWEKVTLIHVECHRDRFSASPEGLSRHWYDLFMLKKSWVNEKAVSSNDILNDVIKHKKAFYSASYTNFDDCLKGKFRLLPDNKGQKELSKDYANMVDAGMFHGIAPSFEEIMDSLKELEKIINQVNIK